MTLLNRWTEALRSGKYKQGQGVLRSYDDEYCCLGVLCDLVDPNGWSRDKLVVSWRFILDGESSTGVMTPAIHKRTGLSMDAARSLVELNDGVTQANFNAIASWIEANVTLEEAV